MNSNSNTIKPPAAYAWQKCLDIEGQDAAHYRDHVNVPLFEVIDGTPRRVLELGCATGKFGEVLKLRFPGATVVGIEAGRSASAIAATRLERVICERIENVDFAAQGFQAGEFDTVIAADILEHLPNPWELLTRLKPFIAAGGQVVASIPNVRNLALVSDLLQGGRWTYTEHGLLDFTHLRFFTVAEIARLFQETGYRMEAYGAIYSPGLIDLYQKNRNQESSTLQLGRITLANVSPRELAELCSEQFLVRSRPV